MSEKGKEVLEMNKKYTMFTWAAQGSVDPVCIEKVDGVYMYDFDGTKYIDASSQLINVNIGFKNEAVIKAIQDMAAKMPYIAPKHGYEERGELGRILVEEIAPDNMAKVLFTNGGADANEYAIRLAKAYSGKDKIFSKYESYHGSTYGAANLTGEALRSSPFPTIPGFIKFPAPHLYTYDIQFDTEEEATKHFLARLEYQIKYEGQDNIAALFIETVTGSNGTYLYPKGYLKGVRELCTKYGILMVCDEVMAGFLRTGTWFACEQEDIKPDMITFAKGVNSGYAPLGGVLISKEISEFFDTHAIPAGLTYNSHGLGVAAAIACINEYKRLDTKGHVNELAPKFKAKMEELKAKHNSVGDVRCIGLFGAIELVADRETREPLKINGGEFMKLMYEHHLATFMHANVIMVGPPLIITEEEMNEMFEYFDEVLKVADEMI
ncbi:MAG: aminotransferase class III-fold pyridoxal phosphate-dependent enzyme [Clostridiales bacterium]|nr:aminotransferase class III-fold pyridoxal phosphate-dependent enzyme [Clostridiales bacterium]